MRVLKFTLAICTIAGFWQPPSWTTLSQHVIYKSYAMFLIFSLYTFSVSQLMDIILNVDNSDELMDSMYMMLTVFVAGYKQVCIWLDRKNIMWMINVLTGKTFSPSGTDEVLIRRKFDKRIQDNTLRYLTLVMTAVATVLLSSILIDYVNGNLTYRAWVPFDYSGSITFTVVYIYQMIGMSTSGIVNVACESLICGFLLHICCQLEILEYRLTKLSRERDLLGDCIYHHTRIFTYAYEVNNVFSRIIAVQFAVSMLVVCSNLYQIAIAANYMSIVPLILYTSAILAQIFIYCWFGNEVKLKSLHVMESIYEMDWLDLSNGNQKALLFVMTRTMFPIEFSSAYIITMNLDSFVALLKMSYSIFNLLRQTQE